MYLHHRFSYVVHEPFQEAVMPLLDEIDPSTSKKGSVNIVINEEGVLKGYWCDNDDEIMKQWSSWKS
jgi:hypothetical protein